ncbi:hypothetical protein [Streptomyces sp. NPDC006640]|uniref:hypothetical protein n=1 Tax=unclassified Streptomyces TaxID=2593676 RepID=UPI003683AA0E
MIHVSSVRRPFVIRHHASLAAHEARCQILSVRRSLCLETSENQQTNNLTPDELPYQQSFLDGTAWAHSAQREGTADDSERECPVRAALLDWLGSLAYDADDESLAVAEHLQR